MYSPWTSERDALLIKSTNNKLPIPKIIEELGGILSRSAIEHRRRKLGIHGHIQSPWNDEKIERLKFLWAGGWSCSQIAADVGDVSRNAVIGKVHRLGLPERVVGAGNGRPRRVSLAPRKPRKPRKSRAKTRLDIVLELPFISQDDLQIAFEQRKTFMELENHHCRWAVGDPAKEDFFFCGAQKVDGLSYCAGHARMAYVAPRRRW